MSNPPTLRRSTQACLRCRQQKMKCSGDADRPCARCVKSGRECTFDSTSTVPPPTWTSNRNPPKEPSVTAGIGRVHSLPSQPCPSTVETSNESSNNQHPRPSRQSPNKRRRVGGSSSPTSRQSCDLLPADDDTPYLAVQGLEDKHSKPLAPQSRPGQHAHTSESNLNTWTLPASPCERQPLLQACLLEADIEPSDAEQMFILFGERIAPFIPSLYNTDFSRLPSTPILVMAAIHSVARYFPDSSSLRSRICHILLRLLKELLFQNTVQSTEETTETMQGLVILYACCEATAGSVSADGQQEQLEILTMRVFIEGYAVKRRFGLTKQSNPAATLSCLWWLWLYTMSHHTSILHGCSRTIGSSAIIHRAKQVVEQNINNARVTALLAEVELCQLWETVLSQSGDLDEKIEQELQSWSCRWNGFLSKAEGRGPNFHYHFIRFHLHTRLVDLKSKSPRAIKPSLDAAQSFLRCTTRLPPMSKDRLRYLCDFGFVMMAYVCVFVIRALRANVVPLNRVEEMHQDVTDVARLMQSFGAKNSTRPAIYGRALEELCKENLNSLQKEASLTQGLLPVNNNNNLGSFPAIEAGQSMIIRQRTTASESMATATSFAWPPVNMASDLRIPTGEGPNPIYQDDNELTNTAVELWGMDSYLSDYNDLMLGIPIAGVYDATM